MSLSLVQLKLHFHTESNVSEIQSVIAQRITPNGNNGSKIFLGCQTESAVEKNTAEAKYRSTVSHLPHQLVLQIEGSKILKSSALSINQGR